MASPDLTSGTVMDSAAALLNDVAKSTYTYTVQLPYLNMALQELQEVFELNEVPMVDTVTSNPLTLPANTSFISFTSTPALPTNLIEPQIVWERTAGINPYTQVTRLEYLPRNEEGIQ